MKKMILLTVILFSGALLFGCCCAGGDFVSTEACMQQCDADLGVCSENCNQLCGMDDECAEGCLDQCMILTENCFASCD